jgi:NDP-sugar pyrophosphorylase family protein
LILAGGKGSRMREIAALTPKVLLPVYDRLQLSRHIDLALANGAETIWLAIDPEQAEIFERYAARLAPGTVRLMIDDVAAGPIGPLCRFLAALQEGAGLILFGDAFFEEPVEILPVTSPADLVIGVAQIGDPSLMTQNCQVVIEQRQVVAFQEKPSPDQVRSELFWTGLVWVPRPLPIAPPEINRWLAFSHAGAILEHLRRAGLRLALFYHRGAVLNLNTPVDLFLANLLEAQRQHAASGEDLRAKLLPWLRRSAGNRSDGS